MRKNNTPKFIGLLLFLFGAQLLCSASAEANLTQRIWESADTSDPTAVEAISGSSFAATAAFTDWAQTQSVSSGAGLSVGATFQLATPVQNASIWLGNFQTTAGTNVTVTAGSYIAISYSGVGADFTVTIDSTYVDSYHANYHETDVVDHTGYVVVYFKMKEFVINAGTNPTAPTVKLADLTSGTLGLEDLGMGLGIITHTNLMDENTDPTGSGMFVSSGLLDSTPEIPPQALPAVYSGLGAGLWTLRNRFARKKQKKNDKK